MLSTTNRVLIVEWESADWLDLHPMRERGELPHLSRLIAEGVHAETAPLPTDIPAVAWTTTITGHFADRHGVFGDEESMVRQVPALWDMVAAQGGRTDVIGGGAAEPAENTNGLFVPASLRNIYAAPELANRPGFRTDELAALRMRPEEVDPFILRLFLAPEAPYPQRCTAVLAPALSADFTVHNLATQALAMGGWSLALVGYRLSEALRYLPDEASRTAARHGMYRLFDLFLGRLCQLAGEDTTILLFSRQGGYRNTSGRHTGVFVLHGREIASGSRAGDVHLIEIVPTVLTLLRLPVGEDMPGQVRTDFWKTPPDVSYIPTWNAVSAPEPPTTGALTDQARRARQHVLIDTFVGIRRFREAIPLLRALRQEQPDTKVTLLLAECLLQTSAAAEAEEILRPLVMAKNVPQARVLLGIAALTQKRMAEGWEHLRAAEIVGQEESSGFFVGIGYAFFQSRQIGEARRAFTKAIERDGENAGAYLGLAGCAILRRDLDAALEQATRAIELHYDNPFAHLIRARAWEWQERIEDAVAAYETALRLKPDWGFVHRSLAKLYDTLPNHTKEAATHRAHFRVTRKSMVCPELNREQ